MDANSSQEEVIDFAVRYAETDAMGIVHHASYLVYFEEGRSHFMRTRGTDYAEFEANGFQLPVTETGIRYLGSLTYGERVCVRTQLTENKSRGITFQYIITSLGGELPLVTGFTRHIWTDRQGKVVRAPAMWQNILQNSSYTARTD